MSDSYSINLKFCSKCQCETERYASRNCKPCAIARSALWKVENPELRKKANAAWYAANTEKVKTTVVAWGVANPDRKKATSATWYAANAERLRSAAADRYTKKPKKSDAEIAEHRAFMLEKGKLRSASWRSANPEKAKARSAAWKAKNLERDRATRRVALAAWRAVNPEAMRIHNQNRRANLSGGILSQGLSAKLFKLQKGKCACCSLPLGDNYHLDHIMPLALGGTNTNDNIQLLRQRCNNQKHAKHPIDFMQSRGFLL